MKCNLKCIKISKCKVNLNNKLVLRRFNQLKNGLNIDLEDFQIRLKRHQMQKLSAPKIKVPLKNLNKWVEHTTTLKIT